MKMFKFIAVAFVILSLALTAFADSTIVDSAMIDTIVVEQVVDSSIVVEPVIEEQTGFFSNLSLYQIALFLVGVFEVIVRLYPTAKNYSVLSLVNSIIDFIFPNNKKEGGKF